MGIRELRQIASQLGIKCYSKLRKAELEQAIETAKKAAATGAKPVGYVNGQPVSVSGDLINGQPAADYFASLEGWDNITPAGHRRRVRKLLKSVGQGRLAIQQNHTSKSAAAA